MVRDIRAIAQLKKFGALYNLIIVLIAAIGGCVLYFVIEDATTPIEEVKQIVAGMIVMIYLIVNLFIKIFLMVDEVARGLSFGMTRRKLFIYSRLADLLEIIVLVAVAYLFISDFGPQLIIKAGVLTFGVITWVEGVAGNSVIRYGKIAYWIYYIVFMFIFIGCPRIFSAVPTLGQAFAIAIDAFITPAYNQAAIWGGLLVFVLAGIVVNWITFRRIPVNVVV